MSLPSPNLDDRDFSRLVDEARQHVMQSCPDWTDLSPGDPGWALVEVFAYLTEVLLYRLNRLPDKAYIEFLRLMGVTLHPPTSASVSLLFRLSRAQEQPVNIPRGTRVTPARTNGSAEPPVFVTARTLTLSPGTTEGNVTAYHCDWVEAEPAGIGSGLPGLSVTASRPPIVAPTGDGLDLVVGVEADAHELGDRVRAIHVQGKSYRLWREVETFANLGSDRQVYRCDRTTGVITFAPSVQSATPQGLSPAEALAAVPTAKREIRLWYRRGGGPTGNVAANTLTVLKDPIPGVQVTNPEAATGGRAAETLDNALARGPLELHALERAVTASDFELLALRHTGAVSRAKAFTQADLWTYAQPGTVEVLLVPQLPEDLTPSQPITAEQCHQQETDDARTQIQHSLDERRPLGTSCVVNWVHYKTVRVQAQVWVHRGEDPAPVKARVLQRRCQTIRPLAWEFGQPLRVDRVYELLRTAEAGISHVEQVRLGVEEAPNQTVRVLTPDPNQPHTWYAGMGETLFRSMNDGEGWERVIRFPNEQIRCIQAHEGAPGLLAIATQLSNQPNQPNSATIYFSKDCGEFWQAAAQTQFRVEDIAWILRAGNVPILLMATSVGLYALPPRSGANPVPLQVDPANPTLGLSAIAVSVDARNTISVIVAAQGMGGVFISRQEGKSNTFSPIGLQGEDIRVLEVQQEGSRSFVWAGVTVVGDDAGRGCHRYELPNAPEGWQPFQQRWVGGSVRAIAFHGSEVYAASHSAGVLRLDSSRADATWHAPPLDCGLPIRDTERLLHPVYTLGLTANPAQESTLLMAGGTVGIYSSIDAGQSYQSASRTEFAETVMLPQSWLFCSGDHEIEVTSL